MYDDYQRRDPRSDPPNKRYRRDDDADPTNPNPSLVVHIRNLNPKATEADLLEALSSFGPIAYATCIPYSRMALVEFENIDSAKACVQYAQTSQINVGGQVAQFNFSTSLCIERMGFEQANPNKVLVFTVLNAVYPIDADVIHQVCRPHGDVVRIAVMHKPTIVQALVEYPNAEVAKSAKHAMNGADIYSGCCTLKEAGLDFNTSKSKILRNESSDHGYVKVNGERLEDVEQIKYLGRIFRKDGTLESEIANRTRAAWAAYHGIAEALNNIGMTRKNQLLNSRVIAAAIYGAETWSTKVKDVQAIQKTINHIWEQAKAGKPPLRE